jgi:hypothetical protein
MSGQKAGSASRNSPIGRFVVGAALACLCVLLLSCPNPASIDPIVADPRLSVVATIPANGDANFGPGQPIVVTFNKDLDPACIQSVAPVVIATDPLDPPLTLTFSLDGPRKLIVDPHPFLQSNHTYVVGLETTLKDPSGAALPQKVDLTFKTGDAPAGDFEINNQDAYVNTSDSVTIKVDANATAAHVRIANSEAGLLNPDYEGPASRPMQVPWTLGAGEGPHRVYMQFFNSDRSASSPVRSYSIVRDTISPEVGPVHPSSLYYNWNNDHDPGANPVRAIPSTISDASGISSYSWTADPGVVFHTALPNSIQSPAITIPGPSPDGTYNVSLTVTDLAGNTSEARGFAILKDTAPPDAPRDAGTLGLWLYTSGMTWRWQHGDNPDCLNDHFLVQLDNLQPFTLSIGEESYQPAGTVGDNETHTLVIRQVDTAGNQSDPLSLPVVITPVAPIDNGNAFYFGVQFRWRDLTGSPSTTKYRIHYAPFDGVVVGGWIEHAFSEGTLISDQYTLTSNINYVWYIDWSINGGGFSSGNRNPPTDGTYYRFTTVQ